MIVITFKGFDLLRLALLNRLYITNNLEAATFLLFLMFALFIPTHLAGFQHQQLTTLISIATNLDCLNDTIDNLL